MVLPNLRSFTMAFLSASLVLGMTACKPEERDRVLLYTKGEYKGKPDDPISDQTLASLTDRADKQRSPLGIGPSQAYATGFSSLGPVNVERMRQQAGPTATAPRMPAQGGGDQGVSIGERTLMQTDPSVRAPKAQTMQPLATSREGGDRNLGQPTATGPQGNRAPLLDDQQRQQLENRLKRMKDF